MHPFSSWNHGSLERVEAELILENRTSNSWLVRFSPSRNEYVISKKTMDLDNYKVRKCRHVSRSIPWYHLGGEVISFQSRYSVDPTSLEASKKIKFRHYRIMLNPKSKLYFIKAPAEFKTVAQLIENYKVAWIKLAPNFNDLSLTLLLAPLPARSPRFQLQFCGPFPKVWPPNSKMFRFLHSFHRIGRRT